VEEGNGGREWGGGKLEKEGKGAGEGALLSRLRQ